VIGRLRGAVVERLGPTEVVLDVGGVGYRVVVGTRTMAALDLGGGGRGDAVLHTHLHVREEALTLFGFSRAAERDCFEALLGAHGVGPSLALAVLDVHDPATLARVVADGDLDALVLVPGVGRKTAARLVIELRSRLELLADPGEVIGPPAGTNGAPGRPSTRAELRAALEQLGYGAEEIARAVGGLPADGDLRELLRDALGQLRHARGAPAR